MALNNALLPVDWARQKKQQDEADLEHARDVLRQVADDKLREVAEGWVVIALQHHRNEEYYREDRDDVMKMAGRFFDALKALALEGNQRARGVLLDEFPHMADELPR